MSPRGAIAERRHFSRTRFTPHLPCLVGETPASLINLSVGSAVVDHDGLLPQRVLRLSFEWHEQIEVDTRLLRTDLAGGQRRSVLEICTPSGALVRTLALQISSAKIARLESLVEASKLINSAIEPDTLIEALLTAARTALGVQDGTVYFVDDRRDQIWTAVGSTRSSAVRFPSGQGIAGHVAKTGESLILGDSFLDPRFDPAVDLISPFRMGAMLCVPVLDREQNVIGVLQFLHQEYQMFRPEDLEFLQEISEHVAIAIQNAALLVDRIEKNRMDTELQLASVIQARLLPPPPTGWTGVELAASSVSCLEVGGDYHDFLELPGGDLGLAIGDVSGKGVAAALIMSSAQAALRIAAPTEPDLASLISRLDALLFQSTPPEKFVTFFFGRFSRRTGVLRYVNAGHHPPFVCVDGVLRRLEATGPPLGLLHHPVFSESSIRLDAGATLVLYTDGFCEAQNAEGIEFGMKRWEALVLASPDRPPVTLSQFLTDEILRYEDGTPAVDDKTLVLFQPAE